MISFEQIHCTPTCTIDKASYNELKEKADILDAILSANADDRFVQVKHPGGQQEQFKLGDAKQSLDMLKAFVLTKPRYLPDSTRYLSGLTINQSYFTELVKAIKSSTKIVLPEPMCVSVVFWTMAFVRLSSIAILALIPT